MKICISASIRFKKEIGKVSKELDNLGIDYFTPVMDLPKEKELPEMTLPLVQEHFDRINKSDAIFVINPGGYIGNSVKIEIGYAKGVGKKVYFLEKTNQPELDCLADDFIAINKLDKLRL